MSEVFVAERGQLTAVAKRELREQGIAVVEVKDLTRYRFMRASEVVSPDAMLWAALDALNVNDGTHRNGEAQRQRLVANLVKVALAAKPQEVQS